MTRPFVKVYRYRLRPEAASGCVDAWARAQAIYARHAPMTSVHLQSAEDPEAWLELVNADSDHDAVWRKVEAALAEPRVESESFEEAARFP